MTLQTLRGGCHCGAIRFTVQADIDQAEVLDCNCSICRKKGFLHLIVSPTAFELVSGEDSLAEYRFNSMVAVHTFCKHCGIHAFYTPRSHPDMIDVNVRCLEIDLETINTTPFDGQNWEDNVDTIR